MTIPSLNDLLTNPSCLDDYDPNAMSVTQAKLFIQQFLSPITETTELALRDALGHVLAEPVISPYNVPGYDNSAMDGFAFRHADHTKPLTIIGTAFAGKPFDRAIVSSECVKIMTGAMIPSGADTVVMQERVTVEDGLLHIQQVPTLGANIRLAGEDIGLNQTALSQGKLLRPADLGLIASLGFASVQVFRPLKVAFFSTGDELISTGQPLKTGQIYDSNRYTLYGMLKRIGVAITDFGIVPDQPAQLESTLLTAAQTHDVVITSGGVSVGEADHMKALLSQYGQILFWKINMKPGRPLAYGKIHTPQHTAHYFGLPGNPVATMVTFYQFVREALMRLMGTEPMPLPTFRLKCTEPIKKMTGRTEFQRGIMFLDQQEWKVKPTGNQSSGVLSSMSKANCLIILDEATGNCEPDSLVMVQPLEGII